MTLTIKHSVGKNGGRNERGDVAVVQGLLTAILVKENHRDSGIALRWIPTIYGASLGDVIERFQSERKLLRHPDGRVDPGGTTWKKLIELAGSPPAPRPGPAPTPAPGGLRRFDDEPAGYRERESLPQLAGPRDLGSQWDISWGGVATRAVDSWFYECPQHITNRYIGVAVPRGCRQPDAFLLYFHHPIGQDLTPYHSSLGYLNWGIGDYFVGRMQLKRQLALSNKNVAIVIPSPVPSGMGDFQDNETFIEEALLRIASDIKGSPVTALPPLLLAGYSGALEYMDKFSAKAPRIASRVRAVFDFDGAWHVKLRNTTLAQYTALGARVFRYQGGVSPLPGTKESPMAFQMRMNAKSIVPLPFARWRTHPNIRQAAAMGQGWWLHHYIPTCMLYHGLVSCDFLG